MPRLLLLSSGRFLIDHAQVFEKPFKDMKMVYVITASKSVPNTDYVVRTRKFFKEQGYNVCELDLDGKNEDELNVMLRNYELVYVEGGNAFYLLKSIRASGFDKVVKKLLPQGLIYMGASAGSYVACPTIEMAAWRHQDKYNHHNVTNLTGMNLVPFLVTVHYKEEYRAVLLEKIPQASLPVRILGDEQALLVEEGVSKLIGQGEEIKL